MNEDKITNVLTQNFTKMHGKYKAIYIILPGKYDYSISGEYKINIVGCNKKEDILNWMEMEPDMLDNIWKMKPNTFKVISDPQNAYDDYGNWNIFRMNIE